MVASDKKLQIISTRFIDLRLWSPRKIAGCVRNGVMAKEECVRRFENGSMVQLAQHDNLH